jgi:hypothetical protein
MVQLKVSQPDGLLVGVVLMMAFFIIERAFESIKLLSELVRDRRYLAETRAAVAHARRNRQSARRQPFLRETARDPDAETLPKGSG